MKGKRPLLRWFYVLISCFLLLLLYMGIYRIGKKHTNSEQNNEISICEIKNGEKESLEYMEDKAAEQVYERVKLINYSIGEYPINAKVYDSEMDREYKNAFLQALLSRTLIKTKDGVNYYFRETRTELNYDQCINNDEACINFIKELFHFYYLDFTGDGLPELIISSQIPRDPQFGGPRILKYCPDNKQVYDIRSGDEGIWELLGVGKMYYHNDVIFEYGYREINAYGEVIKEVIFDKGRDELPYYHISVDEFQGIEVGEEIWNELTIDFFEAEANAISYMTYEELFGDVTLP